MTDQCDAAERNQAELGQQSQKMSAWGDQLAHLVAALEELADYFEKYTAAQPSGPISLPEQQLRNLSDRSHKVCRVQNACISKDLCSSQTCDWTGCGVLGIVCLLQGLGSELGLGILQCKPCKVIFRVCFIFIIDY